MTMGERIDIELAQRNMQLQKKRQELSSLAQKLYEETGALSDPVLCELSNEYTDLAYEYLQLAGRGKAKEGTGKTD